MTTVTEEMVDAVCSHMFWITMISPPPVVHLDEVGQAWRQQIRECLEAALAVMPVPDDDVDDPNYTIPLLGEPAFVTSGVPVGGPQTDAEFEAAVDALVQSAAEAGCRTNHYGKIRVIINKTHVESARRTLLAMHAQAQQQGLIEQIRPSRKEFADHVDTLIQDAYESAMGLGEIGRVDESRREVMRMAGYPEER